MKINEWLESKNVKKLDRHTLEAIEEFIGGTQIAIAAESIQQSNDYNEWVRKNTFTKREQFAGFALIGLTPNDYMDIGDIVDLSYAIADKMLEARHD